MSGKRLLTRRELQINVRQREYEYGASISVRVTSAVKEVAFKEEEDGYLATS